MLAREYVGEEGTGGRALNDGDGGPFAAMSTSLAFVYFRGTSDGLRTMMELQALQNNVQESMRVSQKGIIVA